MKKIRDNAAGAPGGTWLWKCPETNLLVKHTNIQGLRKAVLAYLRANNFPVSSQFEESFEQNICEQLPGACIDWSPPSVVDKMTSAGKALWQIVRRGNKLVVTEEVLAYRRQQCEQCNFYGGSTSPIKVACKKCGCSGLKLWLQSSRCPHENPRWLPV